MRSRAAGAGLAGHLESSLLRCGVDRLGVTAVFAQHPATDKLVEPVLEFVRIRLDVIPGQGPAIVLEFHRDPEIGAHGFDEVLRGTVDGIGDVADVQHDGFDAVAPALDFAQQCGHFVPVEGVLATFWVNVDHGMGWF